MKIITKIYAEQLENEKILFFTEIMPASHIILVFRELLSMLSLPDVYLLVYVIIRNCIIQSRVYCIYYCL
jgi:hypothetical protein